MTRVGSASADAPLRVVVVTFSPGGTLAGFLDSLALATSRPYEVVLAENGSTDGVPERAARERPEVTLLRTGGNIGYGAAANAALQGDLTPEQRARVEELLKLSERVLRRRRVLRG